MKSKSGKREKSLESCSFTIFGQKSPNRSCYKFWCINSLTAVNFAKSILGRSRDFMLASSQRWPLSLKVYIVYTTLQSVKADDTLQTYYCEQSIRSLAYSIQLRGGVIPNAMSATLPRTKMPQIVGGIAAGARTVYLHSFCICSVRVIIRTVPETLRSSMIYRLQTCVTDYHRST
jgi:hypothetical protein